MNKYFLNNIQKLFQIENRKSLYTNTVINNIYI